MQFFLMKLNFINNERGLTQLQIYNRLGNEKISVTLLYISTSSHHVSIYWYLGRQNSYELRAFLSIDAQMSFFVRDVIKECAKILRDCSSVSYRLILHGQLMKKTILPCQISLISDFLRTKIAPTENTSCFFPAGIIVSL